MCFMIDIKERKHGSCNQDASPSGKTTRISLVPCHIWKWVTTAISGGVDIPEVSWCYLLPQMSSQWGLKHYFKYKCLIHSRPVFLIVKSYFNSMKWLYYQIFRFFIISFPVCLSSFSSSFSCNFMPCSECSALIEKQPNYKLKR